MAGAAAMLLVACPQGASPVGPPLNQLYFPVGMAHVEAPGSDAGILLVATANFDKRYSSGSIVALALDELELPPMGAPGVTTLENLKLSAEQSVQIASFAGQLAVHRLASNSARVYVPTRSEGMAVFQAQVSVDSSGHPTLSCNDSGERDCTSLGVSLSPKEFELSDAGVPRAPSPYGVAVGERACTVQADCCPDAEPSCARSCVSGVCQGADGQPFADVWVSHMTAADSPLLSGLNYRSYLVRIDSDHFSVGAENFFPIGQGPADSLAVRGPWVFGTGRILSPSPNLIRAFNRQGVVVESSLESSYRASDSRGLAFSSDGSRLYVAGRIPDTLLVLSVTESQGFPFVQLLRAISLPDAPNAVTVIPRPGQRDLVAVTCSIAGSVALYDDDVGDLVSLIPGVGVQPFALAAVRRGPSARMFVSNFGDGRIAVIDVPRLDVPQSARVVAYLGAQQLCLTRGKESPGCLGSGGVP